MSQTELVEVIGSLEARLCEIERKVESVRNQSRKSMEWIGMLSEHIHSLDSFRVEVRESFEPISDKLGCIDDVVRILRHATADVSRRIGNVEDQVDVDSRQFSA